MYPADHCEAPARLKSFAKFTTITALSLRLQTRIDFFSLEKIKFEFPQSLQNTEPGRRRLI